MIKDKITDMLFAAIKSDEPQKVAVYRLIKNEFMKYATQPGKPEITEAVEISILQKMVKQREDSISQYEAANRFDLAEGERQEMNIIKSMLPKTPTREDIEAYVSYWYPDGIEKKSMGGIIKKIKEDLPGADGSVVASVVKECLV